MILDRNDNLAAYAACHPGLAAAAEFLKRTDLAELPDGHCAIDGDRMFALVQRTAGRGRDKSPLEAHRKYIDVQAILAGIDVIGWKPTGECMPDAKGFDAARDIGFFTDRPESWLHLPAGTTGVFFPADAHAPLAGKGALHKVVVKIAV